jgi:hypothetical protein
MLKNRNMPPVTMTLSMRYWLNVQHKGRKMNNVQRLTLSHLRNPLRVKPLHLPDSYHPNTSLVNMLRSTLSQIVRHHPPCLILNKPCSMMLSSKPQLTKSPSKLLQVVVGVQGKNKQLTGYR